MLFLASDKANEIRNEIIAEFPNVQLKCRLEEILEEVGMNMLELSLLTGIRYQTIHDLAKNKKSGFNLSYLLPIIVALRIKDFNELFYLDLGDESEEFEKEHEMYRKNGVPDEVMQQMQTNALRQGREKELGKQRLKSTGE